MQIDPDLPQVVAIPAAREPQPSERERVRQPFQWLIFAFAVLLALCVASDLRRTSIPGAPVELLYATLALAICCVALHWPRVFWLQPSAGRQLSYILLVVTFVAAGFEFNQMEQAYTRTPDGAIEAAAAMKEAAQQAKIDGEDARRAASAQKESDKTKELLAKAEVIHNQLEDYAARVEACFTTFGHRLPGLEEKIRNSLHNPSAFEHVETVATVPDAQENNIAMTFRAENGFGAIRSATVRARLDPQSCEVVGVGDLNSL